MSSSPLDQADYTSVALDLIRQSLQAGATIRLPVAGTSMLPLLRPGDAVWLVAVDPALLQPGDLVAVLQPDRLLTHRLIAVGPHGWQTKGDNNRHADPSVAITAIQGRIVSLERGGALICLHDRSWLLVNRLLGRIGWLEQRWQRLIHPKSARLVYVGGAGFRLVIRTIVAVAVRC